MIYLMNSAVFPQGSYGTYEYQKASLEDLREVLQGKHGQWQSTIGYPQNLDLIEQWTGVRVPLNRVNAALQPGDSAFVMRLRQRVADPATKGAPVSADPNDWEFAWIAMVRSCAAKKSATPR